MREDIEGLSFLPNLRMKNKKRLVTSYTKSNINLTL